MSERTHWLTRFAELRDLCDAFGTVLVDTFHYLALFALGATTVWSAIAAFLGMVYRGEPNSATSCSCLSISKSEPGIVPCQSVPSGRSQPLRFEIRHLARLLRISAQLVEYEQTDRGR